MLVGGAATYDFDAPQYADLANEAPSSSMSPTSQGWFEDQSRKNPGSNPTAVNVGSKPQPPPPPPLPIASTTPSAPKAWTPSATASKPTESKAAESKPAESKPADTAAKAAQEKAAAAATKAEQEAPAKAAKEQAAAEQKAKIFQAKREKAIAAKAAADAKAAEDAQKKATADAQKKTAADAQKKAEGAAGVKKPAAATQPVRAPASARAAPPAPASARAAPPPAPASARAAQPTPRESAKPTPRESRLTGSQSVPELGRRTAAKAGPPALLTSSRESKPMLSSEERELQDAAKRIEEAQKLNAQRRAQLTKVLASTATRLPKRSTATLTMPEEFELSGGRSEPSTPTQSPRAEARSKPLAEQLKDFSKTPRRFRTRAPTAAPSPMPVKSDPRTFTRSASFDLSTAHRSRPTTAKSTAEREAEEMASMPKFRAQPLNRKILQSAGDLGVPRVQRPAPTQFEEFRLSQGNGRPSLGSSASDTELHKPFKARPYNKQLMEGKALGLAQVTPRKATRPKSPELATNARAAQRAPATAEPSSARDEPFAVFKARPMPTFSPKSSPRPQSAGPRPITSPRPFALATDARATLDEQARQRRLRDIEEKEAQDRCFRARQMPVGEAWRPAAASKPATAAAPFALQSEARGAVHESARQSALEQAAREEREQREFHARSADVLKKHAFTATKSTRPLTEINGYRLSSAEQAEKRKAREKEQAAKKAAKEREEREEAVVKQRHEAQELLAYRRSLVQKARPATVLKKEPFRPRVGASRPTQPMSPHLSSSSRVRAA